MPLHIDYRPDSFSKLHGNTATVRALRAIYEGRGSDWPHAVLMHGQSGCGKTTVARIIAAHLKCEDMELHEINAANNRGIDTARSIMSEMTYRPRSGPVKVYIIDECHATSNDFQNSILKALEDTPSHVYFILCTTDPGKLLPTIRNRCMQFEMQSLSDRETADVVSDVLEREQISDIPPEVIKEIAAAAEGCPRQALVILDKVIDMQLDEMRDAVQQLRVGGDKGVIDLARALLDRKKWPVIIGIIDGMDKSNSALEKIRLGVLGYMASVMLSTKGSDKGTVAQAALVIDCFKDPWYNMGRAGLARCCLESVIDEKGNFL